MNRNRVLLADRDWKIRTTLSRALAKTGFDVTSVDIAEDALYEVRAERFDVLISNPNLHPDNPLAIIHEMQRVQPGCLNFVLDDSPLNVQAAHDAGVAGCFAKPVDAGEIVHVIKQKLVLHRAPALPAHALDPRLKYAWQQPVLEAFMESRPEYLPAKINIAERAISDRLIDPAPASNEERVALREALRSLQALLPSAQNGEAADAEAEIA